VTEILSAHRGNDTGGTGWRIAKAFVGHDGWAFRSACNPSAVLNYLSYPEDLPWHIPLLRELFAEADVFHARNDWGTYRVLADGRRGPDGRVIHYHGTNYRHLWGTRLREQAEHRAIGLVSTLDLWLIAPQQTEWLPSPYDLEWLASLAT